MNLFFLNLQLLVLLFIPLVPLAWGIIAGGVGLAGRGVYKYYKKHAKKLGVLGMQAAGKTRFLCHLRDVEYVEKQTSEDPYNGFFYTRNGISIYIKAGVDIGGGDIYAKKYIKMIDESDVIFYFFDLSKYLNNSEYGGDLSYRRQCNSRFELIANYKPEKPVVYVGTHIDKCPDDADTCKRNFLELLDNKTYYSALENMETLNTTNEKELNDFIGKFFKK